MRLPWPLLASLTVAACAVQDEVRTTSDVYLAELPDLRGEQEWIGCRVLDAVTGRLIAGRAAPACGSYFPTASLCRTASMSCSRASIDPASGTA
jgi:hypothetical protein